MLWPPDHEPSELSLNNCTTQDRCSVRSGAEEFRLGPRVDWARLTRRTIVGYNLRQTEQLVNQPCCTANNPQFT